MRKILLSLLRIYKTAISPMLGRNCKFYPTCSTYAMAVLNGDHCLFSAILLIVKRILKCNPWGYGGYDPPPEK